VSDHVRRYYLRNTIHRNTAIDSARIARSNFMPAILSASPARRKQTQKLGAESLPVSIRGKK